MVALSSWSGLAATLLGYSDSAKTSDNYSPPLFPWDSYETDN